MKSNRSYGRKGRYAGFTLVETLVTVLILGIVMAVATNAMVQLTKRTNSDAGRVDMTQMSRQFMDQIVNDLHQAGYPGTKVFDPSGATSGNSTAVGLIKVDPTDVEFEADVDGSGNVSHVWLQLLWSNGNLVSSGSGSCPCTLQRGTLYKSLVGSSAVPFYTEISNVVNPNSSTSPAIFAAYFFDGTPVSLPAASTDLPNITNIKVTVSLQSAVAEANGVFPTITMASEAKIINDEQ